MSQGNRVETMALKLAAYASRAGVDAQPLLQAYTAAVGLRLRVVADVFDRELLHPARTALILLEDAGVTSATLLAAGALVETEHSGLRLAPDLIKRELGAEVAQLVAAVPIPAEAGDELAERLVTAPDDVALIAVAERLDHARHLHFRERALWADFYQQIVAVYLPFSYRVSSGVAVRLERWAEAFGRRLAS